MGKQAFRRHFIAEWCEYKGKRQADICRDIGASKGLVSKWFAGAMPREKWLTELAKYFDVEVTDLFKHPSDDWISKFLQNSTPQQRDQAIQILKTIFDPVHKN